MKARTRALTNQISNRVNPERIGGEAIGGATNSTKLSIGAWSASASARQRPKEVNVKTLIHRVSLAAVVLALLAGGTVYSQSPSILVANIPFDFHVGTATLPAGSYIVKPADFTAGVLQIQNKDNGKSALAPTFAGSPTNRETQPKLVFNRYGADYFLSKVCNPYRSIIHQLPRSKAEKEIARNTGAAQTTEVALEKK